MKIRYIIKAYTTIGERDTQVLYYTSPIRRAEDVGEWHRWIGYAKLFEFDAEAGAFACGLKIQNNLCMAVEQIITPYALSDAKNDFIRQNMSVNQK